MSKLSGLAVRIALFGAATAGVVAACYEQVPGPSAPLPPTQEVKPLGSKPKRLKPAVEINQQFGPGQHEEEKEKQVPSPTTEPSDAGIADVIDLPPVPDADVTLDAPGVNKQ